MIVTLLKWRIKRDSTYISGVLESDELSQFFEKFLGGPVITFDWKVYKL